MTKNLMMAQTVLGEIAKQACDEIRKRAEEYEAHSAKEKIEELILSFNEIEDPRVEKLLNALDDANLEHESIIADLCYQEGLELGMKLGRLITLLKDDNEAMELIFAAAV